MQNVLKGHSSPLTATISFTGLSEFRSHLPLGCISRNFPCAGLAWQSILIMEEGHSLLSVGTKCTPISSSCCSLRRSYLQIKLQTGGRFCYPALFPYIPYSHLQLPLPPPFSTGSRCISALFHHRKRQLEERVLKENQRIRKGFNSPSSPATSQCKLHPSSTLLSSCLAKTWILELYLLANLKAGPQTKGPQNILWHTQDHWLL